MCLLKPIARIFFILLMMVSSPQLVAQCLSVPVLPGCAPPGGVALSEGDVITTGQTKVFSGTGTFNMVTLNGGTLIICGTLTLNDVVITNGTLIVNAGATLNVYGGVSLVTGSNVNIYNCGTLNFYRNVVTGPNNVIINCQPSASLNVPFAQFIVQGANTFFVNNGSCQFSYLIVQSTNAPACVCLGANSTIRTSILINQFNNSVVVPSGVACLNVTNTVINSSPVTATPATMVCVPASVSYIGAPFWGSATVNSTCSSCAVPLPLVSFKLNVEQLSEQVVLTWENSSPLVCNFTIERFNASGQYEVLAQIDQSASPAKVCRFEDNNVLPGEHYDYRIKANNCQGGNYFSSINSISVKEYEATNNWLMPVPATDFVLIKDSGKTKQVKIYNSLMELKMEVFNEEQLDISALPAGIYFVEKITESGSKVLRLQKNDR